MEINGQSKDSSRSRKSNQVTHINETKERRNFGNLKPSSGPSVLTDLSSGIRSARFDEYSSLSSGTRSARFDEYSSFSASKSNSQFLTAASHKPGRVSYSEELVRQEDAYLISHESLHSNYMAKTESCRAKARSQSAPRSMPESFERKLSGKQRDFFGGGAARKDQFAWYNELDRTTTNADYYRSIGT